MRNKEAIETDGAPVLKAEKLSLDIIQDLFSRRIAAIHVPNYFASGLAARADKKILDNSPINPWYVGENNNIRSDMNYSVGFPRQQAGKSKAAAQVYKEGALGFAQKLREIFAPDTSPMDQLINDLELLWPHGAQIEAFQGSPGYAGIVRVMTVANLIDRELGVCHVDGSVEETKLSANLYLSIPPSGGELKIWNIKLSAETKYKNLYKLINNHAFDPVSRKFIQMFLPHPKIIRPQAGDLVILDVCRPHAVTGFSEGHRTSVQTFLSLRNGLESPILLQS